MINSHILKVLFKEEPRLQNAILGLLFPSLLAKRESESNELVYLRPGREIGKSRKSETPMSNNFSVQIKLSRVAQDTHPQDCSYAL